MKAPKTVPTKMYVVVSDISVLSNLRKKRYKIFPRWVANKLYAGEDPYSGTFLVEIPEARPCGKSQVSIGEETLTVLRYFEEAVVRKVMENQ